jgi:hypothetical protein
MEKELSTHPKKRIRPQKYLELERKAEIKSRLSCGSVDHKVDLSIAS